MRSKKTIKVSDLVTMVNTSLSNYSLSHNAYENKTDVKHIMDGMKLLLENALFSTGNYKGFRYLTKNEIPDGELPGINDDGTFNNTDPNRINYFYGTMINSIKK